MLLGWVTDRKQEMTDAEGLARRGGELGKDDAIALSAGGNAVVIVVGDIVDGAAMIDRALQLNPNLAWAWLSSALARVSLGDPEAAIEHAARAIHQQRACASPCNLVHYGSFTVA